MSVKRKVVTVESGRTLASLLPRVRWHYVKAEEIRQPAFGGRSASCATIRRCPTDCCQVDVRSGRTRPPFILNADIARNVCYPRTHQSQIGQMRTSTSSSCRLVARPTAWTVCCNVVSSPIPEGRKHRWAGIGRDAYRHACSDARELAPGLSPSGAARSATRCPRRAKLPVCSTMCAVV
jgi:hypothetical protein